MHKIVLCTNTTLQKRLVVLTTEWLPWLQETVVKQWRIQGGGTQGTFPPLEPSNAVLLGRGLAVATYISLTSHLLPPESRLLAS